LRIAVLTGGGHASGLNAGIEGIADGAFERGWDVVGVRYGWQGMEEGNLVKLSKKDLSGIKDYGGSILGSGRWKPDLEGVMETVKENDIDSIVALGGDDTLSVLSNLWKDYGLPAVGWPKTMDNDLDGTYFSIGYPKAVSTAAETTRCAVDVACTHRRVALVSVFGRITDWVAVGTAAYGDADLIIPGERTMELEELYEEVKGVFYENEDVYGRPFAVVVVAEGASIEGLDTHVKEDDVNVDDFGHPKLDPHELVSSLSDAIKYMSSEEGTVINTAPIALTYELRNGPPLDVDRTLGYMCGEKCVELLDGGDTGKMASIERDGDDLYVGEEDLTEGCSVSRVRDTDYFDYENLSPTDSYLHYAEPFLGKPEKRTAKSI